MGEKKPVSSSIIFGPVPSRRLGMSLGIDVVPMKVCSYDCIYCELGKTTNRTLERKDYVPEPAIILAMERYFTEKHNGRLDYVTFSGSGEPTLNAKIGALIRKAKEITDTPVAVLTNGSLLYDPQVRLDLMQADLVIPSLDAAKQNAFIKVNQPAASLNVSDIIRGIHRFCQEFKGEIWLEILLVRGVNDHPDHIRSLSEAARLIDPAKIQLTTVVRPPGKGHALPVGPEKLHEISLQFEGNVEVVADLTKQDNPAYKKEKGDEVISMLKIRPMTLEDISSATGMHRNEALKYLDQLRREHTVHNVDFSGKMYFTIDREKNIRHDK
ncbi:MAG: radical SAM protein [Deltaproteobacteria bacterium]|nr:radical SAM protein [Deltaproteobacteria bacterium]